VASQQSAQADCDYIVVGSGAGGGPLAARLAEAGHRVILLEAGGDPRELVGGDLVEPNVNRLPHDYDVPAFHAFASENEALKWNFFVRHYRDDHTQKRDPNYREFYNGTRVDGVLYPRAATLGGCTAHNAMILIYPHDADWDNIAALTGDASWNANNMRKYFRRMENCHYRPLYRWLSRLGFNPGRHGFRGWLHTEKAVPMLSARNYNLFEVIVDSALVAIEAIGEKVDRARLLVETQLDPNDWRAVREDSIGLRYLPLTTHKHARNGARERVREVAARYPERLKIVLNALVTRVLLDENRRAIGVEYVKGGRLYRVSANSRGDGERCELRASREVILAGGAFNTPQLLMLSGIGPRVELERHGIEVKVDLPGIGKNLQDRYEAAVVNRMNFPEWEVFRGAKFDSSDTQFKQWQAHRGPYITNGSVLALFKRSAPDRPLPDLFCMALLGKFDGYYPGYSREFPKHLNYLTWAVLKAHTNNRAGQITLRSADPLDPPNIDFRYFQDGTPDNDEDLDSVVSGIKFARKMTAHLKNIELIAEEESPGQAVQSDDELRDYVRRSAWGHHASCSCPIGPREQNGVLTSDFRVHGTEGLRVVDASVFPRIPGFFIASAVYMIAEKAAEVILHSEKAFPLAPVVRGADRSGLVSKCPPHQLPYGIIFEEYKARRPKCLKDAVLQELVHPQGARKSDSKDTPEENPESPRRAFTQDPEEALWETSLKDKLGELAAKYEELEKRKSDPETQPSTIDDLQRQCRELEKPLKRVLHRMSASALCLSGGGIRSASFGLGILEGLARFSSGVIDPNQKAKVAPDSHHGPEELPPPDECSRKPDDKPSGLLHQLDYLSTVSGGGYIGSWLSAWIYRRWKAAVISEEKVRDTARNTLNSLRAPHGNSPDGDEPQEIRDAQSALQTAEDALENAKRKELAGCYHNVIASLAGQTATTSADPAPRPVRYLREYTSYLAPALGLSLDYWTLAAIVLRNLFINWLMLLPILVAVVALPQVMYYVSLEVAAWFRCQDDWTWFGLGFALVLGLFIRAATFAAKNLPSHREAASTGPGLARTIANFAIPVLLANWLLVELWWSASGYVIIRTQLALAGALIFGISLVGLLFLCRAIFRTYTAHVRVSKHAYLVQGRQKKLRGVYMFLAAIISAAWATGLAALLGLLIFPALAQHLAVTSFSPTGALFCCDVVTPGQQQGAFSFHADQRLIMTFGLPLITLVPLFTVSLLSGLLGNFEVEEDREWWSRAAAIQLAVICGWALAHAVALYSADTLHIVWFAVSGAVFGGAGSALGWSGKTSAGPRPVKKEQLGKVGSFLEKHALVLPALCGIALLLLAMGAAVGETVFAQFLCPRVGHFGSAFSAGLRAHAIILFGAIALAFLMNRAVSINIFSLNGLYRMRLMRAFLGASNTQRQPDAFTGFDPQDTPAEIDLPNAPGAPLHLINTTLNLVGTKNTAWRQRKAEPFSFTPLHSGSWRLGYVPTRYYAGANGPTLATAMSISGAAFNPNMGYHSSPLVTLLMTFFNVRLGWWLPNPSREEGAHFWAKGSPKGKDFLRRTNPLLALEPLILEALGMTDDTYRWIELTDGGHFENLGLYEMVMRRCKKIIVIDAGADPKCEFEDLGNALRKIEIDLGIPIRFGDMNMLAGANPKNRYCAVATIDYQCVDDDPNLPDEQRKALAGQLIYIKAAITGMEPPDIKQYSLTHDDFPHETTANQFFNESQFESYRHLGSYEIESIVKSGQVRPNEQGENVQGTSSTTPDEGLLGRDFETFLALASRYAMSPVQGVSETKPRDFE